MKKRIFLIILVIIVLGLFVYNFQYNNQTSDIKTWNYSELDRWSEFSLDCIEGEYQSPINIISSQTISTSNTQLDINYKQIKISTIHNLGYEINIKVQKDYFIEYQSELYQLIRFHFHSDGEHIIDGVHKPLEMHLVHSDTNNNVTVIGVLFKEGNHNVAFQQFLDNTPEEIGQEKIYNEIFNISALLPINRAFYSYDGSLTTPECTEGVNWIVMKAPVEVSSKQITEFLAFRNNKKNNRPTQDTGERTIYYTGN